MEKKFTVEEAQDKLYTALAEETSFKYLKSQKCLKKVVNNLVFEIYFFRVNGINLGVRIDI